MNILSLGWKHRGLMTTVLFVLLSCSSAGQISGKADTTGGVLTFNVSAQQEQNFNAFISWLNTQASFKLDEGLINAYHGTFAAMKQNNYAEYVSWGKKLGEEFAKLSREQKAAMHQFFLTLSVENVALPAPANSCNASCLFGSCSISCPTGTKPKCFCQWGEPQCGCEPYQSSPSPK